MLKDEIDTAQRFVKTDAYQLSVGEVVNMYKDKELVINPDFQRLFRWELGQKSKLIESLLLGIPLPSIFVFEKDDSTWELIDGLQRISTLLEFMGELKDPATGQLKPPTALVGTKYLPSLDKAVWTESQQVVDVPVGDQHPLLSQHQLAIKRSRLSVEILKRPSDNATKYDLFQRLNAGGIAANAQELRNCIIIMVNAQYAAFMRGLSESQAFLTVLAASEDQIEKQRHMEYVSRFLAHTYVPYDGRLDVEEFINESVVTLATANETQQAGATFAATFNLLNQAYGADALRRFQNGVPGGRVGLAAFEGIAVGIAKNIAHIQGKANPVQYVSQRIGEFWQAPRGCKFLRRRVAGNNPHPADGPLWGSMVRRMSKPYTEQDLSDIFDVDLIWRRKELSDIKAAIKVADAASKPALLRAIIAMSYAHWEGYVRTCANRYFEHLTLRKKPFAEFERQIYVNSVLGRLEALHQGRLGLQARCDLVNDILDGASGRFSYLNPDLVDTRSNLNTDVITDICTICGVDSSHFSQSRTFIDVILLKRRNAIAHGRQEFIQADEIDDLVANILALMSFFRTLLENKIYTKAYAA